jgi:DNA repair protein RecN (Recombination protein N)
MGDNHFYIHKVPVDGKTVVKIEKLDNQSKTKEIARMLGGSTLTELTLKHAEEMIYLSQNIKKSINI